MALLGLFSKRDKSKSSRSTTPSKSNSSEAGSSEADYVLPNSSTTPTVPNGLYSNPAASSSKLKLGFGRKSMADAQRPGGAKLQPPLLSIPSSARSEADLANIRPPLSKSALFADSPSSKSTRSLPTKPSHSRTNSREVESVDSHTNSDAAKSDKQRKGRNGLKSGLLGWARNRSKSRPPPPPAELTVDPDSSFNLKSFRHIGPESPPNDLPRPPSALSTPLSAPQLRPRGNSVASDTSQRISVAAFREAARRNPSPSPALRPPSRTELSHTPLPIPGRRPAVTPSAARSSTALALSSDSTSSESESEESESEDSVGSATLRPRRNRTITQRSAGKASSELGHRTNTPTATPTVTPSRLTKSNLGHGDEGSKSPPSSAPRSSRPGSIYARQRASLSTSALQPNAAARRASLRAGSKVPLPGPSRRPVTQNISNSSDSDSDDSDDAPLSTLVGPKRPGSSASSATSGSRPRIPGKPLIDLSGISPPTLPPLPSFDYSTSPAQEKPPTSSLDKSEKPSVTDRLARIAQTAGTKSKENLSDKAPPERRSLDYFQFTDSNDRKDEEKSSGKSLPQPTRSQTTPISPADSNSSRNTRLKPKGRSLSTPDASPVDLTDPTPIVPTLIRERSPPPAFSVTSRPMSQASMSRLSGSASPNDGMPTIRAVPASSSSTPDTDKNKMPAPTSALTPRGNPTLQNPPPRTSSMVMNVMVPSAKKPSDDGFTGGGLLSSAAANPSNSSSSASSPSGSSRPRAVRQRSSTMVDAVSPTTKSKGNDASSVYSRSSAHLNSLMPSPSTGIPPPRPFVETNTRGNSPGSSTGDSSSGRLPLTPADGSEVGYGKKKLGSESSSAMSSGSTSSPITNHKKSHRKSSSLTFEMPERDRGRPPARERAEKESPSEEEQRRRERRRSEAKAAVELGNIVNGRGPIVDDDDEDVPLNSMGPRMSMMNPMLNFTPPSPMTWRPQSTMMPGGMPGMPAPGMMFPVPPPNMDPAFLAAHQQAMMAAKQAYQMAVAQQALAQANEEWERGSTATSAYGGGGFGGMGMGMPMGMSVGMPGMFPGPYNMPGWTGSMMFPNTAQSMYAGSVVGGSELGVSGGWGSQSVYGGPGDRSSRMFAGGNAGISDSRSEAFGPTSSSTQPLRPGPRPRTKTAPSDGSLPTQHARSRNAPPPSSWNNTKRPQRG